MDQFQVALLLLLLDLLQLLQLIQEPFLRLVTHLVGGIPQPMDLAQHMRLLHQHSFHPAIRLYMRSGIQQLPITSTVVQVRALRQQPQQRARQATRLWLRKERCQSPILIFQGGIPALMEPEQITQQVSRHMHHREISRFMHSGQSPQVRQLLILDRI